MKNIPFPPGIFAATARARPGVYTTDTNDPSGAAATRVSGRDSTLPWYSLEEPRGCMASLTTDGLRVALWSTDPLVAGFLQQQLGSLGLDVQVVRDTTPGLLAEFDVLLWDLGPDPEPPAQAVIESPPTVALCTSATIGAAALQSGVRAAVDRSRPPDSLVSVLLAAAAGLMVTEPGWMDTAPLSRQTARSPRANTKYSSCSPKGCRTVTSANSYL